METLTSKRFNLKWMESMQVCWIENCSLLDHLLMDPIANYGTKAVTGYSRSIQLYNMQHSKMVNDAIEKF